MQSLQDYTYSGAPRQKKRFNDNNLHYIRNASINLDDHHRLITENQIRYGRDPQMVLKAAQLINDD